MSFRDSKKFVKGATVRIKSEFLTHGKPSLYVVLRVYRSMLLVRRVSGGSSYTYPMEAFDVV